MSIEGRFVYGDDEYISEEYQDEQWERIHSPEDYYVSNKGRVWSSLSHQFIKPKKVDRHGHLGVCLSNGGRTRYAYVHRLVAEAFLNNNHNDPIVRHLDDDPGNNCVDNLSWGTQTDNMRDSIENGHFYYITDEDREKALQKVRKPVYGINEKTGEKVRYRSQTDAARELGLRQANIGKVLSKQRIRTGEYRFEFAED